MPGDIAIRAVGLTKKFRSGDSELVVFANLDLEIERGEHLALVGESGAGKSTLLHLLGGLDQPSDGKVYYGSSELTGLADAALAGFRNRTIGFLWQGHYLLPEFTALENVMMPLLIRGMPRSGAEAEARARLEEVGLAARAWHRAGELSGGEQQRVALARALAGRPQVLLADEPTGNLDAKTGELIISLLADLHRSHRLTSVCVTHNLAFARRCDRILKLEAGRLAPLGAEAPGPCEGSEAYV
jgi:lipoprotein-releasing system ATP-binding protein